MTESSVTRATSPADLYVCCMQVHTGTDGVTACACACFGQIMVVPHSHNDPGWGWTLVDYYRTRSRHVLDSIVQMMPQLPQMRFMWTEVAFLQLWGEE